MKNVVMFLALVMSPIRSTAADLKAGIEAYGKADFETASIELRPEAEAGNAQAQFYLGEIAGRRSNDTEALKWYRMAAEQGHTAAQYKLGAAYYDGLGVPRHDAEAAIWFRKAADQGDAHAQTALGMMYTAGRGVRRDHTQAARWYRRAAESGLAEAQLFLGVAYGAGWGVPKDHSQEASWLRKAADQGHAQAQAALGESYAKGEGVPQDFVLAYMWLNLAASKETSLGRAPAKMRDAVADMMTREQIAEAQQLARQWHVKQH